MTQNRLSEDAAHRLIARAIELDARRAEEVSIAQLREVAQEAGISLQAFEEALHEVGSLEVMPKLSVRERFRRWVRGNQEVSSRPILDRIGINVVAFAAFWATAFLFGRAGDAMTTTWVGQAGGILVANLLGVGIARRLNARVTMLVLSVTAIAQTAEFVLHLIYGIGSVQSGPTHLAVMLASLLGVGAGVVASHRIGVNTTEDVDANRPAEEPTRGVTERVRATLRLRPT
jgi:hypothetical protein